MNLYEELGETQIINPVKKTTFSIPKLQITHTGGNWHQTWK